MASRPKGSRPIEVGGVSLLWRLGRPRGDVTTPLTVWTDTRPQSRLLIKIRGVWLDQIPEWLPTGHGTPVTPAFVANLIQLALDGGWRPDVLGSCFEIESDPPDRNWQPGEYESHIESWDRTWRARSAAKD